MQVRKIYQIHSLEYQSGVSLLFAMILVLVLTMVAITATNVSGLQELTARNYQYNTEAFNEAYGEIDAQLADILANNNAGTIEAPILQQTDRGQTTTLAARRTIANGLLERQVGDLEITNLRDCVTDGDTLASGKATTTNSCDVYSIKSAVRVSETSLGSSQNQLFTYKK